MESGRDGEKTKEDLAKDLKDFHKFELKLRISRWVFRLLIILVIAYLVTNWRWVF
jgi:hypothetical protein